ncbi:MAG: carboxypeptidase regulatory-like domain-containing protein, partial [Terriglobia bacterium]
MLSLRNGLFLFLALTVFSCLNLTAQEITGNIRGSILDPSGAGVPNAAVTATQTETGLLRTVSSDRRGNYVLVELPIGHYRLQAEAKGFQKYVQEGISLDVNETATVAIRLALGRATQTVQVNANAPLIESSVTSLGKTVLEREILDLPLNGRNFSQLGVLQPGVVPITPGLAEAGGSLREGQAYAVNGQRPESNNFLIDGAANFNGVDGGFVLKPPIDAIAEFKILTHAANAEFGYSAGSTTNIITRSGSNQIHGALWDFLRNDGMDSRNFFAQNVEPLKQNQFGGTLGGPIRKDKTFFFGYYEGFRNRQGQTQVATVPSILERQGDFSETIDPSTGQVDPLINEFTGQPFPGNKLPFINPISQKLLGFYPLPNEGPNQFVT